MKRRAIGSHVASQKLARSAFDKDVQCAVRTCKEKGGRKTNELLSDDLSSEEGDDEEEEEEEDVLYFGKSDSSLNVAFSQYVSPTSSIAGLSLPPSTARNSSAASVVDAQSASSRVTSSDSDTSPPSSSPSSNAASDGHYVGGASRHQAHTFLRLLSYGVKFFLITLFSRGHLSWDQFCLDGARPLLHLPSFDALQLLLHPQSEGSSMKELHLCASRFITPALLDACKEVDREEEMLRNGRGYLNDPETNWVGGRVSFDGDLYFDDRDGQANIRLRAPSLKPSRRFHRQYGSSRFLRLKAWHSAGKPNQRLEKFLERPVYVLDCVFHPILIEVNASKQRATITFFEDKSSKTPIYDFYNRHGSWTDNKTSTTAKFVQRIHLGLSTTIPGPSILQMNKVSDVVSPKGRVMTDGAAPVSRAVMIAIAETLGLKQAPSAVQARYGGAKGVWYLASDRIAHDGEVGQLWIDVRSSQTKLQQGRGTQECHRVLDIVATPGPTKPSSLSKQIISILASNGVPNDVFVKMQAEQMHQMFIQIFGEANERTGRLEIAKVMDEFGSVSIGRAHQGTFHLARAKGLISRAFQDMQEEEGEEDAGIDDMNHSPAKMTEQPTCQSPSSNAYDMALAGCEVGESRTFTNCVIEALKLRLDRVLEKYQIPILRSTEVIVIPDPVGVLEEGEIQMQFGSNIPIDPDTRERIHFLQGDVLVTRHPCLTPVDIRKVTATHYPALSQYADVIIFSTKGDRPLADLLSGGDYDGDTVRVFWEPRLVKPFRNADIDACKETITIDDAFDRETELVEHFLKADTDTREENLRRKIMKVMTVNDCRGHYGKYHEVATYQHGAKSPQTIDIAFKFNNCMDGVKTGLTIKEDVWRADERKYNLALPNRKVRRKEYVNFDTRQPARGLKDDIFDVMWKEGGKALDLIKKDLERKSHSHHYKVDSHLAIRWEEAVRKNRITDVQAKVMKDHSLSILASFSEVRGRYGKERDAERSSPRKSPAKRVARAPAAQDGPHSLDRAFAQLPAKYEAWIHDKRKAFQIAGLRVPEEDCTLQDRIDIDELQRLKHLLASCLYVEACAFKKTYGEGRAGEYEEVAFKVAWQDLLTMKAAEVAKQEGQPLSSFPASTACCLRLRPVKAAK
ncbi:hypothetical protein CBS101457_001523 [Exobasidium rhododendri]|nr:hypothetical protein CBS101457_001523 [Exobasidium rhododendri]